MPAFLWRRESEIGSFTFRFSFRKELDSISTSRSRPQDFELVVSQWHTCGENLKASLKKVAEIEKSVGILAAQRAAAETEETAHVNEKEHEAAVADLKEAKEAVKSAQNHEGI